MHEPILVGWDLRLRVEVDGHRRHDNRQPEDQASDLLFSVHQGQTSAPEIPEHHEREQGEPDDAQPEIDGLRCAVCHGRILRLAGRLFNHY
jgi:hypothetical protein